MIEGFNPYDLYIHEKKLSVERQIRQGKLASSEQIALAKAILREESEARRHSERPGKNGLSIHTHVKLRP